MTVCRRFWSVGGQHLIPPPACTFNGLGGGKPVVIATACLKVRYFLSSGGGGTDSLGPRGQLNEWFT